MSELCAVDRSGRDDKETSVADERGGDVEDVEEALLLREEDVGELMFITSLCRTRRRGSECLFG